MASLRKHPKSDNWIACFTLADGRRTQRSTGVPLCGKDQRDTADKRREAQDKANLFEEIARGKKTARQLQKVIADLYRETTGSAVLAASVRSYFDSWLTRKKPEIAPSSFAFYSAKKADFLAWLGERAANDIRTLTSADILNYRNWSAERVSPATVNHNLKTVRMVFESAKREGFLVENPAEMVGAVKRSQRGERRAFTLPELRAILAVADDEWRSLIHFGFYTGQRLGDLARLTWQNIDLEQNEIRLATSKTGRRQIIPIATPLRRHIEGLPTGDDPKQPLHPSAFAFVAQQQNTATLSRLFYDLMAQAGLVSEKTHQKAEDGAGRKGRRQISEISFHALRHTATSLLKNAGVSPAIVQEFIGHDSEAVNRLYTHIETSAMRKAADALPDLATAKP